MQNNDKHIELITRFLAGEAKEDEHLLLERLRKDDPAFDKLFREYEKIWNTTSNVNYIPGIDVDKEWDRLEYKITGKSTTSKTISFPGANISNTSQFISRIAAGLFILIGLSAVLYVVLNTFTYQKVVADTGVVSTELPDRSTIVLNKNASVKFPETFDKKETRKVFLKGDAYFDVQKDQQKPFIVETQRVLVKVLGTSFYVNASDVNKVSVIVKSGKVAVYIKNNEQNQVVLNAGEKTVFEKDRQTLQKMENKNINYLSWKTKKIIFKNERLSEVVKTINNTYHSNIQIGSPGLEQCRITVTFEDQSLESVLRVLKNTLNIRVHPSGDTITISGNSCKENE